MTSQLQALLSEPLLLGLIWSIFALGVFISFRILGIPDMSVEGVFPFAAVLAIWALKAGWNPILALLLAIGVGMAAGALNGVMGRYLKIDPLLAGIILMTALFSLTIVISNGNISLADGSTTLFTPFEDLFATISNVYWKNFCGDLLLLGIAAIVLFTFVYWFFGTEVGIAIRASGKNEQFSRAEGLNVHFYVILGLAISSGIVACAGALYGMRQSFATINLGKGTLIIGLATIFLGEIALPKMSFKSHLLSLLIGGYIYWLIMSSLELLPNYNANFRYLIQAIFLTIVMLVPSFKKNVVALFKRKKEASHA